MDEPSLYTQKRSAALTAALLCTMFLAGIALVGGPASAQGTTNDPPYVHAGPQKEPCAVYQDCILTGYASDPNGDAIESYMWDLDGDTSEYESVDPAEANQTFVFQKVGTYIATLFAVDEHGAIGDDDYEITVVDANEPPDVTPCDNKIVHAQEWVEFTAMVTDSDGLAKYEWDFDGNGVYDYISTDTPNTWYRYGNKGDFKAAIRVTDKNVIPGITIKTINVTVFPANLPPDADAGPDMTVRAGMDIIIPGSAIDPDGLIILYQWDTNSDGIFDEDSTVNGNLHMTFGSPDLYTLQLKVKDNGQLACYDSDWVNITVQPANRAPTISTTAALKSQANEVVDFDATGNDPDGDPVEFTWDFNGDGKVDWTGSNSGKATWVYGKPGTYIARLSAKDPYTASANATVKVTIDPEPGTTILGMKVGEKDKGPLTILLILGLIIGLVAGIGCGFVAGRKTMRASMIKQLREVEKLEKEEESAFRASTLEGAPVQTPAPPTQPLAPPGMGAVQQAPPPHFEDDMAGSGGFR